MDGDVIEALGAQAVVVVTGRDVVATLVGPATSVTTQLYGGVWSGARVFAVPGTHTRAQHAGLRIVV